MRIAVASNDKIHVTRDVDNCSELVIIDVLDGEIVKKEIRKNIFIDHALGKHEEYKQSNGHGGERGNNEHKRSTDGIKDCQYLISHGMGWKLVRDIKSYGIEPLVITELNAEKAAIMLEEGRLKMKDSFICR